VVTATTTVMSLDTLGLACTATIERLLVILLMVDVHRGNSEAVTSNSVDSVGISCEQQ
jgi:hypothetical protein